MTKPRVFALTGAGISAESGIPTFRGRDGYWRNLDPTKLATQAAFDKKPELVWEWYRERRALIRRSQPNAAHEAIVELAAISRDFLLVTQNVDDLHTRARWKNRALAPEQIVQIHGDIFETRCPACEYSRRDSDEDSTDLPRCPRCAATMRPGVVWFDEELALAEVRRIDSFLAQDQCDIAIAIGTTATFPYIIDWAQTAKGAEGKLIEINPNESALSVYANETIREAAASALPRLVRGLKTT